MEAASAHRRSPGGQQSVRARKRRKRRTKRWHQLEERGREEDVEEEQSWLAPLHHHDSSCKSPLIIVGSGCPLLSDPAPPMCHVEAFTPVSDGSRAKVRHRSPNQISKTSSQRGRQPITAESFLASSLRRLRQPSLAGSSANRNFWQTRLMLSFQLLLPVAGLLLQVVVLLSSAPASQAATSLGGATIKTVPSTNVGRFQRHLRAPEIGESDNIFSKTDQPETSSRSTIEASDSTQIAAWQAAPTEDAAAAAAKQKASFTTASSLPDKRRLSIRSQLDRRHQFPLDRHDNQSANQSNGLFRWPLVNPHEDSSSSPSNSRLVRRLLRAATEHGEPSSPAGRKPRGLLVVPSATTSTTKLAVQAADTSTFATNGDHHEHAAPAVEDEDEEASHNKSLGKAAFFGERHPVGQPPLPNDLSTGTHREAGTSWLLPQDHQPTQEGLSLLAPLDLIMGPPDSIELRQDDLFLAEGSPSSAWAELSWRREQSSSSYQPTLASQLSKRAAGASQELQTIYFGGFFPWLGKEAGQRGGSAGGEQTVLQPTRTSAVDQESSRLAQVGPHQRPPITGTHQRGHRYRQRNISPMINEASANQDAPPAGFQSRLKRLTVPASGGAGLMADGHSSHQHHVENVQSHSLSGTPHSVSISNQRNQQDTHHQLGQFILPSVRLALDHINTNNSLLRHYKLETVPRDTQCNATLSLKEFFDMVYEAPKKMLLYGDACRVSTDPIAKASYFFDLIQISYADTDPIYTIENYPNFFRVVPSENALSLARIPFIRHFNWTRVGTIYQNLPRYSLPHSKLLTDLERFNIVIKQSVSLPGSVEGLQDRDLGDELRKLKEKDVRIILGNFDEEWALLLFCEAFREMMTGRKYQWILTGMNEQKLWHMYRNKGSSCTEQELLVAMDGYIVTDIAAVTRSQAPTISGMMAHEYSNEYRKRAREMNISLQDNKFYGYVYDGVWAIALALNRVDSQLKYYSQLAQLGKVELKPEMRGLSSLLDFNYHKPIWATLIRSALNRTRFEGVTGTVSFQKNERPGLITFSQFQAFRDTSVVVVGSYDGLKEQLDLKVGFPIFWRGPTPPVDYTIERVTPFRINRSLFVILSILAVCGIILACIFLTINIKFRNQRYIKMSSPYLNNLIIIGCILTYTSVIILGLDSGLTSEYNFPYICNARAWVLMAGFTLAFGSMFSKTFRVHSIFTNIKLHKRVIKDYKLFMVVLILLTFDVCILIVWQYFDPFYRETNNGTSIQDLDNEDLIIVPEMEHCQSKRMTIFLTVIYVYKGLLMAFGCFLAWETRHVSIPALNDSKYIGLSVYNVVIMCVIGAALSFVLRDQQDASFVIISIFIIFCSTTTLCLVFVPKLRMLIELKQNPRASDHRVRATLKTFKKNYQDNTFGADSAVGCRDARGNLMPGRTSGFNANERIKELTEQNVKQRFMLKEKTYELEALTYKYRKIQAMIQSQQYEQAVKSTACHDLGVKDSPKTMLDNTLTLPGTSSQADRLVARAKQMAEDNSNLPCKRHPMKDDPRHHLRLTSLSISNSTHIVTSNTTSSNNNHTDLTLDYSSPKVFSCTTTTTTTNDSQANPAATCTTTSALHKSILKNHCRTANSSTSQGLEQSADAKQQHCQASSVLSHRGVLRVVEPAELNPSSNLLLKHTTKTTNSDAAQDPFSIFSHATNKRHRKRNNKYGVQVSNLALWSRGPFCTLIVRKELENQIRQDSGQVVALGRKRQQSCQNNTCWSCPSFPVKSRQLRSRLKQSRFTTNLYSSIGLHHSYNAKLGSWLPRTLSMIEYLGLCEADLIAKRHDKLYRRKDKSLPAPCCYKLSSCLYCAGSGQPASGQMMPLDNPQMAPSSSEPHDLNNMSPHQPLSSMTCSICCSLFSVSSGFSPCRATVISSTNSFSSQTHLSYNDFYNNPNNSNTTHNLHKSRYSSRSSSVADQDFPRLIHHHCRHSDETYSSLADDHNSNSNSTNSSSSTFLGSPNKAQDYGLCSSGAGCCDSIAITAGSNKLSESNHHKLPPLKHNICPTSPIGGTVGMVDSSDDAQQKITIKCDVLENL